MQSLYIFSWNMLAWTLSVSVLFPLTAPWAVYAYKIWHGVKEIREEFEDELWPRGWRASLFFALAAVGITALDYFVIEMLVDLPAGIVHFVLLIGFLGLASGIMIYCFSLEDFFQGLNITVIYLFIPTTIFVILWWIVEWNVLFTFVRSWLKDPKTI
ncbi:MAG: hypothetical protein FJ303_01945 [Planctomycetes bacterium]|nr:hypothetical protein [Planctomycetota bacterium]